MSEADSSRPRRGFIRPFLFIERQSEIVSALMIREMSTRFGRDGLGFAWLVLEPLAFCVGVLLLWNATKPAYEHGIRLSAFVMTGYMCIILMRHQITYSVSAIAANIGLLHHRSVKPLHIFLARNLLEVGGATIAFITVYVALLFLGQASPPHNYLLMYGGWVILASLGMGLALFMAGLAMRFEVIERVVGLFTYILVPLSGAFFMVDWVPAKAQKIYLLIPFPHAIEMLRAGVFGEFVKTHYYPPYAIAWALVLNAAGLLLIAGARDRIEVE